MAIELAAQHKASKGVVGVESLQGRLRLRLPRQAYGGKQKYLSLGLNDTLKQLKQQADSLTLEEQLKLIVYLAKKARQT